jgi:hypothetical protein
VSVWFGCYFDLFICSYVKSTHVLLLQVTCLFFTILLEYDFCFIRIFGWNIISWCLGASTKTPVYLFKLEFVELDALGNILMLQTVVNLLWVKVRLSLVEINNHISQALLFSVATVCCILPHVWWKHVTKLFEGEWPLGVCIFLFLVWLGFV